MILNVTYILERLITFLALFILTEIVGFVSTALYTYSVYCNVMQINYYFGARLLLYT